MHRRSNSETSLSTKFITTLLNPSVCSISHQCSLLGKVLEHVMMVPEASEWYGSFRMIYFNLISDFVVFGWNNLLKTEPSKMPFCFFRCLRDFWFHWASHPCRESEILETLFGAVSSECEVCWSIWSPMIELDYSLVLKIISLASRLSNLVLY